MRILYLDCYSGISGDMFLGAMIDAGVDISLLRRELSLLGLTGYAVKAKRVKRGGISAVKLDVEVTKKEDKRRSLKDIIGIVRRSRLDKASKDKISGIFEKLARAEARVHGAKTKSLHFHEVGDTDSIVDICGAVAAIKILNIDKVYSSAVNVGGGTTIATKGGVLPVPAPATLILLKDKPLVHSGIKSELVTPTGAVILSSLADKFEEFTPMRLDKIGYGAGTYDFKDRPNCLRVMIGRTKEAFLHDSIFVIEANIDDMNPVDYEHLINSLFNKGALDAYLVPVQMKKTRPGILLTVLAKKDDLDELTRVIFTESTTIGVRYHEAGRSKLERVVRRASTRYGSVRLKVSSGPGGIKKVMPEYDDYKRIAERKKIPINQVRKELEKEID